MSLVEKLMKETGADKTTAQYLLEACSDDYQMAVVMYADIQPSTSGAQAASPLGAEDAVRAPIPPKFEVLCPEPQRPLHQHRAPSSWAAAVPHNTAPFRDFEHETRLQEQMMGLGSGIFGTGRNSHKPGRQDGAGPSSRRAGQNSKVSEEKTDYNAKLKKLEDLFKPPLDIIYKGSFFMAREEGKTEGKWLLANIQDNDDFACHTLNRDVWSNTNVRKLLEGHFLLWQAGHKSEHGRKYMNFYPSVTFPYIAVIDSWTGEHMSTFRETDPKAFCLFLKDFISTHGKLASSIEQQSTEHEAPRPSTSKRKSPPSPRRNGHVKPAKLTRTESDDDVSSSSHAAEGKQASTRPGHLGGRTLLDITEEDQMKLAIAESLKTCQSNSSDVDDNDNDDVISLVGSSDEEQEINYSFEDQNESSSGNKKSKNVAQDSASGRLSESQVEDERSGGGSSSKARPKSEWRVAKAQLINGSAPAPGTSSGSSHTPESDDLEWRRLAAEYDESDSTTIALRLPDGKRETITLPRTAPLDVFRLWLRSKGFSGSGYRAFTGWPKKDLLQLPQTQSLKDAGLLSRDTVILQEE